MKYRSTRGAEDGLSFEEVLFAGYASDGGLYMPEKIPRLSEEQLKSMSALSYPDLLKRILTLFIHEEEITKKALDEIVEKAFAQFSIPEVVRIASPGSTLHIAELFHGPTMTFKDLALSVVGQLFDYFLKRRSDHVTVVVGTSGDTGSAAIRAVQGLPSVDIIVLLPKGRCTPIQELQMTTVMNENVHNFVVEGTSDDLDEPIKSVFSDSAYVKKHHLCSINSINWARILVQSAHYAFIYFQKCGKLGNEVEIVVPTGACGNITGGLIAAQMGLPIRMVAAVNTNDIVHRSLTSGDFSPADTVDVSWASAIDIQVPYNVERLLYMASQGDVLRIKKLMNEFETKKALNIPSDLLQWIQRFIVDSLPVSNDEILTAIKQCHDETGYTLCPHTAVAVHYHYQKAPQMPRVCIATASPAKFPEALEHAGIDHILANSIQDLFSQEPRFKEMRLGEDWEAMLRNTIDQIYLQAMK